MPSMNEKLKSFTFNESGPPRYEQLAAFFERAIRGLSSNGTENLHKSLVDLGVKLRPGWRCVDREEV